MVEEEGHDHVVDLEDLEDLEEEGQTHMNAGCQRSDAGCHCLSDCPDFLHSGSGIDYHSVGQEVEESSHLGMVDHMVDIDLPLHQCTLLR